MKIVFHIPELSQSIPCFNNVRNYLNHATRSHETEILDIIMAMRVQP
ncbi:hypothetical protein CDS77_004927 [Salmonella enterica subsp. enterica]|nr:hypothetical protein [Salmonella enterica subsp. enterica]EDS0623269.1 hypothetical protein [Salmonella enterica]EDV3149325.1 hypothetical protein [Salmonella enterica subsp. enterica serovar Chandans]EEE3047224.1 hypothetical protein [Salmonella enterica subsp. enterica serovar Duisburg]EEJ1463479.1 hypothetical protein [Salmonella enterica subsp. enterica serovar Virginia]EEJ6876464.1 hypothetical protein [Salmonella enterica subsp. houtenae]